MSLMNVIVYHPNPIILYQYKGDFVPLQPPQNYSPKGGDSIVAKGNDAKHQGGDSVVAKGNGAKHLPLKNTLFT
jgi:hypothetical protein